MSTLRETVARIDADLRAYAAMGSTVLPGKQSLLRMADDLTAALAKDAEELCHCPPDVLEVWADLYGGDTILDDRCTLCDRKVMVTK